jgi:site-specific DNA-methyltransferase (adenine-specific)
MLPIQIKKIHNQDCIEGMQSLPGECIDLVISDPPFGIGFSSEKANYNRKREFVMDGYVDLPKDSYYDFTFLWVREATRLLKETGSLFVFSGWNNLESILRAVRENGLHTINHIVWKYEFGVYARNKFVTSHYHIIYCSKANDRGKRTFNTDAYHSDTKNQYSDMQDVWFIKRDRSPGTVKTPTKLPYKLIEKLVLYTSNPGDTVLDPFAGSGIVAGVCNQYGRNWVGFEIVSEYAAFANRNYSI